MNVLGPGELACGWGADWLPTLVTTFTAPVWESPDAARQLGLWRFYLEQRWWLRTMPTLSRRRITPQPPSCQREAKGGPTKVLFAIHSIGWLVPKLRVR